MCLLNLPHAMKRFGPLCHLFEGSYCGEGYLRLIKSNMKTGFKGKWKYNTLKKIMTQKSMYHVKRDNTIEEHDKDEENSYKQYKYHSYLSHTETIVDLWMEILFQSCNFLMILLVLFVILPSHSFL